ncbi:actin-like ATPase domain-containing protein [Auriscalpium vulgare]|uniref:Actin-like ATPase domain-containing protein n=1 Tax=Auriscalpium vulgare TaxID=40419 RepID=A0ACB8RQ75_9AGAM|nr:actin-like ATPase domain-containing protein [Auriscalpium vulgare]
MSNQRSGASVCAIRGGVSLDTSGAWGSHTSRTSPTLIFHYTHRAGRITHEKTGARDGDITEAEAETIMNKKAGWRALVGTTDFAEVTRQRATNPNAELAFNIFADRLMSYVGAYFTKLGGQGDALVLSGGIGERSESVEPRREAVERTACLGFKLDDGEDEAAAGE